MKLRKDKWHYRIAYGLKNPIERPNKKSLCIYFWRTVGMIPVWFFVWIGKFTFATALVAIVFIGSLVWQVIVILITPLALIIGYYPNIKEKNMEFLFLFYAIKKIPYIWWVMFQGVFTPHMFKTKGKDEEEDKEQVVSEKEKEEDKKSFLQIPFIPKFRGRPINLVLVSIIIVGYVLYLIRGLIIETISNFETSVTLTSFPINLITLIFLGALLCALFVFLIIQIRKSEGWYMIKSFIRAKIDKACPEIEFVDSEDG